MRILGVCGSLQAGSTNLVLLKSAKALAPAGVEVEIFDGLRALPHFDPDLEADRAIASVEAWRAALSSSDALLIASPEYGHSLPGVVKNAVDWVIGSAELHRKVVAITAAVPVAERGRAGLKALADTLTAVDARIVSRDPIVRGVGFEDAIAALIALVVREARRSDDATA